MRRLRAVWSDLWYAQSQIGMGDEDGNLEKGEELCSESSSHLPRRHVDLGREGHGPPSSSIGSLSTRKYTLLHFQHACRHLWPA